ncbi:hypothetical protein AAFP35_03655 [Gordonia sp. CPCC 206044]|uniref:hypothetical protein n=1 Tax=Gordonia sp. CPCC 206044 TaxID=3140793 RepID=UPI003AF40412
MDDWTGLADFHSSMDYWMRVQRHCAESGLAVADEVALYDLPYLDGQRLMIPNGPGRAEDSDGFRQDSILNDGKWFTLRESGRSRADVYADVVEAWFGTLNDLCKHFIGSYVGESTRMRLNLNLPIVNLRWLDRGPAPGWIESNEPNPNGFEPATRYFKEDEPGRFYFTDAGDGETSFRLNMTWRELNETYAHGIPGVEGVPMPSFSDD